MSMSWKRFPVPEFDYRPLKDLTFNPPKPISSEEEARIVAAAKSGDASVAGAYAVTPNADLLKKLSMEGDNIQMILVALPSSGGHILARSMAWFNQRAYFLDSNAANAKEIMTWHTPRTHNTRLGPEDGIDCNLSHFYLISGRITEDSTIGNCVMIDKDWKPEGKKGVRIIAACDKNPTNFHDSCFVITWAA